MTLHHASNPWRTSRPRHQSVTCTNQVVCGSLGRCKSSTHKNGYGYIWCCVNYKLFKYIWHEWRVREDLLSSFKLQYPHTNFKNLKFVKFGLLFLRTKNLTSRMNTNLYCNVYERMCGYRFWFLTGRHHVCGVCHIRNRSSSSFTLHNGPVCILHLLLVNKTTSTTTHQNGDSLPVALQNPPTPLLTRLQQHLLFPRRTFHKSEQRHIILLLLERRYSSTIPWSAR